MTGLMVDREKERKGKGKRWKRFEDEEDEEDEQGMSRAFRRRSQTNDSVHPTWHSLYS